MNRFSWNLHGWHEPTHRFFLETIGPIEPLTWRGEVPPKLFFLGFHLTGAGGFWGKNFKAVFGNLSIKKVISIFVVWHPIPWKMVVPLKNYFSWLFWEGHILPQMVFCNFLNINWGTSVRFSFSKVYSFKRKFYGV